jgi:hypothetical protein
VRINIKDDVMRQPECATPPEMPRKSQNKSEARSRHEAPGALPAAHGRP